MCPKCNDYAWLVAIIQHRGVTVYPCIKCNSDESKSPKHFDGKEVNEEMGHGQLV